MTSHPRRALCAAALAVLAALLAGCGGAGGDLSTRRVSAVAAENFWGSLVAQLGGSRVSVTSVVTDPNADPHDYQSSASTARAFATADYVVLNGAGYDSWAGKLLDANGAGGRMVRTVADIAGRGSDNPHLWYSPTVVDTVTDRITADLSALDPEGATYFRERHAAVVAALGPVRARVTSIRSRFAGRRVASTESIFVFMAEALGLDILTPPEFMKAVSEGNDPPADTVATFLHQLETRQVDVLVYNRQTSTAVTTNLRQVASAQGIPTVGITETIDPPTADFQTWMAGQLADLESALGTSRR